LNGGSGLAWLVLWFERGVQVLQWDNDGADVRAVVKKPYKETQGRDEVTARQHA
jgi:hypothetical protein